MPLRNHKIHRYVITKMTNIIQLSCKFPYYSFCVIRVYEQYTSSNAFRQCELKSQKMCSTCDYVTLEFTRLRSRRGKNSSTRSRIIKPNYYQIMLSSRAVTHQQKRDIVCDAEPTLKHHCIYWAGTWCHIHT